MIRRLLILPSVAGRGQCARRRAFRRRRCGHARSGPVPVRAVDEPRARARRPRSGTSGRPAASGRSSWVSTSTTSRSPGATRCSSGRSSNGPSSGRRRKRRSPPRSRSPRCSRRRRAATPAGSSWFPSPGAPPRACRSTPIWASTGSPAAALPAPACGLAGDWALNDTVSLIAERNKAFDLWTSRIGARFSLTPLISIDVERRAARAPRRAQLRGRPEPGVRPLTGLQAPVSAR